MVSKYPDVGSGRQLAPVLQELIIDEKVVQTLYGCFGGIGHRLVNEVRPKNARLSRVAERVVSSGIIHSILFELSKTKLDYRLPDFGGEVVKWSANDRETVGVTFTFPDRVGDGRQGSHTDYTIAGPEAVIEPTFETMCATKSALPDMMRKVFPGSDRSGGSLRAVHGRNIGPVEDMIRQNMGSIGHLLR